MPAPIVPTTPPAIVSVPSGTPAPVAEGDDAEAVSFDTVLAAALGEPAVAGADAVAVVGAEKDPAQQPDEGTQNGGQAPALLPQMLDIAVAAPVPLPAAIETPVTSAPAVAPPIDGLTAAKTSLPEAATSAARTPVRPEAARMLPVADTEPQPPDPARIAASTIAASVQEPASSAAAQAAAAELRASASESSSTPDHAVLRGPTADAPVTLVPMAAERAESSARPAAQPVRLDVAAPVGSREFGAEVGNRLVWMASNNHQVAELRVDPPQLGPVEVRLSIANDQATLSITSPHAAVRDAIQASLPRLQDMLQGLGISLGNVSVGAEGFGQGNLDHSSLAQGWNQGEHALPSPAYPLHTAAAASILPLRTGAGVIDVYA